jgi:hypothetical protein
MLNSNRERRFDPVLAAPVRIPPLFQGWDTFLRRMMVEVQVLSVAPARSLSYVTVWDDLGLQSREAAFDSLVACLVQIFDLGRRAV